MIAVLDIQHAGKPRPHHMDRGATARAENGAILVEVEVARAYATECARMLSAAGVGCLILDPGQAGKPETYTQRHARVRALAAGEWAGQRVVYVACHVNSFTDPAANYALTLHDKRSAAGPKVADHIAHALGSLPVSKSIVKPMDAETRGIACIAGIFHGPANLCAVLVEPLFLSCPTHQRFLINGGAVTVGQRLARGLLDAEGAGT